jgi:hypothetical protein
VNPLNSTTIREPARSENNQNILQNGLAMDAFVEQNFFEQKQIKKLGGQTLTNGNSFCEYDDPTFEQNMAG